MPSGIGYDVAPNTYGSLGIPGLGWDVLYFAEGAHITDSEETNISASGIVADSFAVSEGDGCVWHYVVKDGTNYRAGDMTAVWDGSTIKYHERSVEDIGDTSNLTLGVDINGGNVRLLASAASGTWTVKAIRNTI